MCNYIYNTQVGKKYMIEKIERKQFKRLIEDQKWWLRYVPGVVQTVIWVLNLIS